MYLLKSVADTFFYLFLFFRFISIVHPWAHSPCAVICSYMQDA